MDGMQDFKAFKDKSLVDFDHYKDMLDKALKAITFQFDANEKNFKEHSKQILKKCEILYKDDLQYLKDRIEDVKVENGKYHLEARNLCKELKENLEESKKIKEELLGMFDIELQKVKNYEGYYHSIVYIVLKILGIYIECEVETNHGITDAVIKTSKYIFILEFKMGKAKEAIDQIKTKKYYEPHISDKRKVVLLGIGFNKKESNISDFITEEID